MLVRLLLVIAVLLTAVSGAQALTEAEFQALLPAGDTYVDLTDLNTTNTAGGGWPDTSDAFATVNGNVVDDKGHNTTFVEMDMTLSGLDPNTAYFVDGVLFGKANSDGGETYDFSGGFVSGSLTTYLWSAGSQVTTDGGPQGIGLFRVPMGSASSDGSGVLHVFLDKGIQYAWPTNRTQFDGLIYAAVPEPGSLVLLLVGACGLVFWRLRK